MKNIILKIGRADDNDIVCKHDSISRYHLEVFIDDDNNVFITDLNSRNGTFINGNRLIGSTKLEPGAILRLGIDKPIQWNKWISNSDVKSTIQDVPVGNIFNQSAPNYPNKKAVSNSFLYVLIPIALLLICFLVYAIVKGIEPAKDEKKTQVITDTPATAANHDTTKISSDEVPVVKYPDKIRYDYSCMSGPGNNGETDIINFGSDLSDAVLDIWGNEIGLKEEVEYGGKLHDKVKEDYDIITGGEANQKLQNLLFNLTRAIPNPRGFNYKIYLIISDDLNAFTAGGRIYITNRMFNFCKTMDELACVIGHEIYHNELGHIRNGIRQASIPGGEIFQLMTISFNQKNETECDLHGIDLAINTGYDGCAAVRLWKRMKNEYDNGDYDAFENLFRSHPYSSNREYCANNHISSNYGKSCR